MDENYFVYMMTNKNQTVLYTGVTGDLSKRVAEHRAGKGGYMTGKYGVNRLV